ncbi:MAG: AI-2E family transporter [Gemmatimonadaceae bacterium]
MTTAADTVRRLRVAPILTATVLTVLLLWMFGRAVEVFLLLFIAILISLYLGATADFFSRRLRLPRRFAMGLAVVVSMGALIGLLTMLVPPVIEQTQQLIRVLPATITSWEEGIARFIARFPALQQFWKPGENKILVAVYDNLSGGFHDVVPKVFAAVHGFINLFAVGIMSLYLALHPGVYREWLIALFPPVHRDLIRDVLGDLAGQLRAWIVGQLTAMFVLAVFTALGLYLLDVPFWLPFGIFTGAVAIVPFFGTLVSTVIPALFVLTGGGWAGFSPVGHAWLVVLLGTVIHLFESNIVIPLITADKVKLPPVLTIMSVLVVGKIVGGFGLLIAVPLLVVIMVVVRRILINRIYEGQGFRKTARDRALVLRVPAPDGGVLAADAPPIDLVAYAEGMRARRTA